MQCTVWSSLLSIGFGSKLDHTVHCMFLLSCQPVIIVVVVNQPLMPLFVSPLKRHNKPWNHIDVVSALSEDSSSEIGSKVNHRQNVHDLISP